jgi:hypothetical protein
MNPWLILAAAIALAGLTGGAYWQGRKDGAAGEVATQVREERAAVIASDAAASAIAAAIPKITVKHQTVRQELEREIQTRDVYRNVACDTGPDSLRRYNSTLAGDELQPAAPHHSGVSASSASN